MKHLNIVCLIVLVTATVACTKTNKTQYVGVWKATNVSLDGKTWDKTVLPEEEMTLTIAKDNTMTMKMGDYEETANWSVNKKGEIVMAEQTATLDDAGNLVAEHNGMTVRFERD